MQNLVFKNITDKRIKDCFIATYEAFDVLHSHHFSLEQLPLRKYTMRAQPVINLAFWHRKSRYYRVQISNHLQMRKYVDMESLPSEVLKGWLAHELGHIMDYQNRTAFGMLYFMIGYLFFPNYRMGAERRADMFAIEHGFGDQLMATKHFILDQSKLPEKYKKRIKRYYLSPTELEEILIAKREELAA